MTAPGSLDAPPALGSVLLATDGHGATDAPALAARRLAARLGTRLDVVAVVEPPSALAVGFEVAALPAELDGSRRDELEAAVRRRLAPVLGASERYRLDVRVGAPARAIADAARESGAALVVVGHGGHRAVDRLLGDEIALQVVRRATAPVLAVAPGPDAPIRRAVVGVDFGAASIRAARAALSLLEPGADGDAQLTLVHVRSPLDDAPDGRDPRASDFASDFAADYEASVGTMFVRLREMLRPLVPQGVTVETRIRSGRIVECLLESAEETGAALVAVGTRGPGWAERLFVGSVSTGVLRRAGRSVLVAPAPDAAERVRLELAVAGRVALERARDWGGALDALTRRNAGRRARLEVGGREPWGCVDGLVVEAVAYRFLGASYDPHDGRAEIMLGDDGGLARHLTHGIPGVRAVEIVADAGGRDHALLIEDERGESVLTFVD